MTPEQFLEMLNEYLGKTEAFARLGTIPASYISGRPTVLFDGEAVASTKTYPYLSTYTPTASHRVLLIRSGATWVVVGRVL